MEWNVLLYSLLILLPALPLKLGATSKTAAVACKPAFVEGRCLEADVEFTIEVVYSGSRSVSVSLLEPDNPLRAWAECLAAKWPKYEVLSRPLEPGVHTVKIHLQAGECSIVASEL